MFKAVLLLFTALAKRSLVTQENCENMVYNLLFEYAYGGTLYDLTKKSSGSGLP